MAFQANPALTFVFLCQISSTPSNHFWYSRFYVNIYEYSPSGNPFYDRQPDDWQIRDVPDGVDTAALHEGVRGSFSREFIA